jgi:hypothetical protein
MANLARASNGAQPEAGPSPSQLAPPSSALPVPSPPRQNGQNGMKASPGPSFPGGRDLIGESEDAGHYQQMPLHPPQ